jgi:spore coat polysaccharide biosynthesis protein SpsF
MKKIYIIIQARMTSTRLPNKVMLPLFNNFSVLEVFLKRLWRFKDNIIVATTDDTTSEPIVNLCKKININFYKGSMDNVVERYYQSAKSFGAKNDDIIIRICSDSPCIVSDIVEDMIQFYNNSNFDYVINDTKEGTPKGLNVEVFSFDILKQTYLNAKTKFEKEHVTPYMKENYKVGKFINQFNHSDISLTLDTNSDYEYLKKLFENLDTIHFNYKQLIETAKDL